MRLIVVFLVFILFSCNGDLFDISNDPKTLDCSDFMEDIKLEHEEGRSVDYIIDCLVDVDDIDDAELKVYPTLCRNNITIQSSLETIHLRVFDITGKLIQQQEVYTGQKTIDTSSFIRGVYLFTFESNKCKRTIKIVKQ